MIRDLLIVFYLMAVFGGTVTGIMVLLFMALNQWEQGRVSDFLDWLGIGRRRRERRQTPHVSGD